MGSSTVLPLYPPVPLGGYRGELPHGNSANVCFDSAPRIIGVGLEGLVC